MAILIEDLCEKDKTITRTSFNWQRCVVTFKSLQILTTVDYTDFSLSQRKHSYWNKVRYSILL